MKKLLALAMAMVLALGLAACFGGNEGETTETTTTTEPTTAMPDTTPVTTAAAATTPVTHPSFDYMDLFHRLEGCWNTGYWKTESGEGYRRFVGFVYNEFNDGKPSLYFGTYDGEGAVYELMGGQSTGESTAELVIRYPEEIYGTEVIPERVWTVLVDFTDFDDGTISLIIERPGGEWETYTYGGTDFGIAQRLFKKN